MLFFLGGCVNPFAPKLDNDIGGEAELISDQKTVDGIFKNFLYAYTFQDTTIYGKFLAPEFVFTYRDYEREIDVSWGRDEEMRVTHGLFQNTERLDLIWNNVVSITGDSTNIIRSFNLTITLNPTDIIFIDGKVNIDLKKDNQGVWLITKWIDESNF